MVWVFPTPKNLACVTTVTQLAWLFAEFGSGVAEAATAKLVYEPVAIALNSIVSIAD